MFVSKQGSTVSGLVDAFAIMVSIALQYGVPLEDITRKFKQTRYDPAGLTSNPAIPKATSILDYIAQWMELRFIGAERTTANNSDVEFDSSPAPPISGSSDGGESGQSVKLVVEGSNPSYRTIPIPIRNNSGVCCSDCGSIMAHEEGCLKCWGCGNSKC